jgi:hypothetical protein
MKKRKLGKRPPGGPEIVSLNEELFSLANGDPWAAIDARLAHAIASGPACETFTCSSFGACSSFSCGTFKVN